MTDLTEQWKKGELPSGWYWVEGCRAEGIYAYTAEYLNNMYRPRNDERIVEQVPSYREWQDLKSKLQLKETAYDFDTARLEEENTKLKELLKGNKSLNEAVISTFDWLKTITTPSQRDMCQKVVTHTTELNEKIDEFLGDKTDEPQS